MEICKDGYNCPWGRRVSDTQIVCSMPRCVMTEDEQDEDFRFFERMMSSANTYERRNGKLRPRRYQGSG